MDVLHAVVTNYLSLKQLITFVTGGPEVPALSGTDQLDFSVARLSTISPSPYKTRMISLIAGPIAGPSRLRCLARSIHYTARPYDAPKRRMRVTTTPTLPSSPIISQQIQQIPRQSPVQAPIASIPQGSHTSQRTPPLAATWHWKPLPNTSSDVIEEERTIFARPFESGRPRMYWFGFLVSGLFFTTWLTFPPSARSLAPTDGETYVPSCSLYPVQWNRLINREYRESPMDVFIHYAGVTAVASVTVAAFAFMAIPSRYVTRLSLIRSRPTTGTGEGKVFWRMRHAGHEMFSETSKRSQPRDIAMEDLNIKMLYSGGSESSTFIS